MLYLHNRLYIICRIDTSRQQRDYTVGRISLTLSIIISYLPSLVQKSIAPPLACLLKVYSMVDCLCKRRLAHIFCLSHTKRSHTTCGYFCLDASGESLVIILYNRMRS